MCETWLNITNIDKVDIPNYKLFSNVRSGKIGRGTGILVHKSLRCRERKDLEIKSITFCTVSLSLFADPERILRRFYVFAEEPCKSTIKTSEPCSPVFKEAQPRPKKQSISLISQIGIFMNFIIVHNVFLLLVIYCCNKASNRIVTRSKELVFYSWIPLSPEVSRLSPYTHARQHTRTSRSFCIFAVHRLHTPRKITLHWWRIRCPVEGETNSGSSVADCVHTAIFQNIRENRVP